MKAIRISSLIFIIGLLNWCSSSKIYAQSLNDSLHHYIRIANKFQQAEEVTKSYDYFKRLRTFYKREKSRDMLVICDYYIARIQFEMGDYTKSENTAVTALHQLDEFEITPWVKSTRLSLNNHLGILYRLKHDWKSALEHYADALKYASDDKKGRIYNNIGNVHKEQEDYVTAISYFDKAYALGKATSDRARSLDNLGEAQYLNGNPSGLFNLKRALLLREQDSLYLGIITSYGHLSDYFLHIKNNDSAVWYANQGISVAKQTGIGHYLIEAFKKKMSVHPDEDVVWYHKKLDSLEKVRLSGENAFAAYRYKNEGLRKKAAEGERRNFILLLTVLLLVVIAISGYKVLSVNHRKDKLKEVHNTEARISKKVHDEVANDVYRIMNKIQSSAPSHEILDDIEAVYFKTRDISKETAAIDVLHDFKNELNDLLLTYNTQGVKVITQGVSKIDWKSLDDFKKKHFIKY